MIFPPSFFFFFFFFFSGFFITITLPSFASVVNDAFVAAPFFVFLFGFVVFFAFGSGSSSRHGRGGRRE